VRRECGCRADPIVFGHTECELGPKWVAVLEKHAFYTKRRLVSAARS